MSVHGAEMDSKLLPSTLLPYYPLPITLYPLSSITHYHLHFTKHYPLPFSLYPLSFTLYQAIPITHYSLPFTKHYPLPITHYPLAFTLNFNGHVIFNYTFIGSLFITRMVSLLRSELSKYNQF